VQSLAFDAWGLRRNAATWAPLASPFAGTQPTKRGYTGHEHLDNVELVHMNGRVQDPKLGLFISADPLVQAPYHSPSHNRYSYVWNNPASLVDPSGFQVGISFCPQPSGRPEDPDAQVHCVNAFVAAMSFFDAMGWLSDGADPGLNRELGSSIMGPASDARPAPQGGVGINWGLVRQSFSQMTADDWRGSVRDAVEDALEFPLASQIDSVGGVGDLINSGVDLTEGNWKGAAVTAVTSRIPGSKALRSFAGGAYGKLKSIVGWERHHMPADSTSPLSRARGPAIQMEQAEHALTSSYGNSAAAQGYRQEIGALIQQGRWRDAMAQEIRDVRRIAGSKYNQAVQQMLEYGRSIGVID
jgi:RHS repeat-associated protein